MRERPSGGEGHSARREMTLYIVKANGTRCNFACEFGESSSLGTSGRSKLHAIFSQIKITDNVHVLEGVSVANQRMRSKRSAIHMKPVFHSGLGLGAGGDVQVGLWLHERLLELLRFAQHRSVWVCSPRMPGSLWNLGHGLGDENYEIGSLAWVVPIMLCHPS